MYQWQKNGLIIIGLALISSSIFLAPSVDAKKPKPNSNNGQGNQPTTTVTPSNQLIVLNNTQKNQLTAILNDDNNNLIGIETRRQIDAQINSLPPGMYNRLQKGKGLPPGIAKKIVLPREVVHYIGIPGDRCDFLVFGSTVVLWDRSANIIQDVLYGLIQL